MRKIKWPFILILLFSAISACGTLRSNEVEPADPAPTPSAEETAASMATLKPLPVIGPAPEFQNDVWINSESLRLADLQGKVVLLEFWTFG